MCDLFLDVVLRQSLVILIEDIFVDLRLREPAPLTCQHLFPESTFYAELSFVVFSFVGRRVGPPTAFPFGHWCTVGVLPGPTGVPQSPG